MYQVTLDGKVLYDPKLKGYNIFEPKLQLEVNKTGAFDFKIYPSNPRYNQINKLTSIIEVYQRGVLLFRGRPLNDDTDFDNGKSVQCEGELAYLNDSIVRPYEYSGGVRGYLEMLVNQHNSQVDAYKQFEVGNVTVTDPNDYIVRADSQYLSAWEIIEAKLIKMLGGYLILRRSNNTNYIDYLEDSTYRSDQVIKLGDNMLDLNKSLRGESIVTALIPTGATLENEDEETGEITEIVVDITSVNNGIDFVTHQEAVDRFGLIFKHVSYENITEPSNLLTRATQELAKMISYTENITIKAIDKNMIDVDFHRFRFFEYVKVVSKPHGIDENYLIKKQVINLINPKENTIEIGVERSTLTDDRLNIKDELNVIRDETVQNSNKVSETYKRLSQTIIQTADRYSREIKKEVSSEIEQLREETSTQFEQTKNDFLFQFTQILEQVENVDEETKTQFLEIVKYIRFIDGNIILGQEGNELILKISNDRIAFIQENAEVAYFSNQKLYVTDAEFINTLQLGKFAFYPLENGNLTFKKVVD